MKSYIKQPLHFITIKNIYLKLPGSTVAEIYWNESMSQFFFSFVYGVARGLSQKMYVPKRVGMIFAVNFFPFDVEQTEWNAYNRLTFKVWTHWELVMLITS